jgi:hypothetical protein
MNYPYLVILHYLKAMYPTVCCCDLEAVHQFLMDGNYPKGYTLISVIELCSKSEEDYEAALEWATNSAA